MEFHLTPLYSICGDIYCVQKGKREGFTEVDAITHSQHSCHPLVLRAEKFVNFDFFSVLSGCLVLRLILVQVLFKDGGWSGFYKLYD